MMKQFEIKNLKKEIKLDYINFPENEIGNKKTTYIFAKNGVGKTTYTKQMNKIAEENGSKNLFVFNTDFVAKNLFVNDYKDGENRNNNGVNQKENLYQLTFGETLNKIEKDIELNNDALKTSKDSFEQSKNDELSNWSQIKKYISKSIKSTDFKENIDYNIEENMINDNFKIKVKIIENIEFNINFVQKINIIINLLKNFKKTISQLNMSLNEITNEEKDVIELHKQALKISKHPFKFMGNIIELDELEKYIKKIDDKKSDSLNKYNIAFSEINSKLNEIIELNQIAKNLPDTYVIKKDELIKEFSNFRLYKMEDYDLIDSPIEFTELEIPEKEKILLEIKNFLEENYLKIVFQDVGESLSKIWKFEKESIVLKNKKIDQMEVMMQTYSSRINDLLMHFSLPELKISLIPKQNSSRSGLVEIGLNGKELKNISEGEKNILAFCYFIAVFEKTISDSSKIDDDIILILDDPFDSNDHTKLNKIKTLTFNYNDKVLRGIPAYLKEVREKNEIETRYVLFTHNANVLYSLTSSMIDFKNDKVPFFRMLNTELEDSVDSFELIRHTNDNDIFFSKKNISSFYPNELIIIDYLKIIFSKLIKEYEENSTRNEYFVLFKVLNYIFSRLLEKSENSISLNFKSLIRCPEWKKDQTIMKASEMENSLNEIFKNFLKTDIDEEKLKTFVKNYHNYYSLHRNDSLPADYNEILSDILEIDDVWTQKDIDILHEFISRTTKVIEKASLSRDEDLFRRLRHREDLTSTIVAFGLQEF